MVHSVAILGASGYTGAELVRLIATHPDLRIAALTLALGFGVFLVYHTTKVAWTDPTAVFLYSFHVVVFLVLAARGHVEWSRSWRAGGAQS